MNDNLPPLPEFEKWLRSVCFQAPPAHAYDLARCAWIESDKQASVDVEVMAEEIERLQNALAFWMPGVPEASHALHERVARDAYLLAGYDGPNNEPSAFELGHVSLAAIEANTPAVPDGVSSTGKMTHQRAKFFMLRFMAEEKLLGPNEQAALAHVINLLEREQYAAPQPQPVAQPVQASEWQPIETAPKDMGSYLFLCSNVTLHGFRDATGVLCVCQEDGKRWRVMRITPTHWMPLPDAPKPANQQKE